MQDFLDAVSSIFTLVGYRSFLSEGVSGDPRLKAARHAAPSTRPRDSEAWPSPGSLYDFLRYPLLSPQPKLPGAGRQISVLL